MPELLFNKVAGVRTSFLLKKRLWHRCFPENFAKFLRTFSYRTQSGAARQSEKTFTVMITFKVNESRYILNIFSIAFVNIYLFSTFLNRFWPVKKCLYRDSLTLVKS